MRAFIRGLIRGFFRPPRRSAARVICVVAPLAGVVCWYFGVDVLHSIAIAAATAAAGAVWVAIPLHTYASWSQRSYNRDGARHDVVQLSWSLRSRNKRLRGVAFKRVQDLGRHRLARYRSEGQQLNPANPTHAVAIASLIGRRAYRVLCADEHRPPHVRAMQHCIAMLDALDRRDESKGGSPT